MNARGKQKAEREHSPAAILMAVGWSGMRPCMYMRSKSRPLLQYCLPVVAPRQSVVGGCSMQARK